MEAVKSGDYSACNYKTFKNMKEASFVRDTHEFSRHTSVRFIIAYFVNFGYFMIK